MNESTKRYNKKTYSNYMFRVRKDSELEVKIQSMIAEGHSLNWLLTELICNHLGVPMPYRYRFITTREPLCKPVPDAKKEKES